MTSVTKSNRVDIVAASLSAACVFHCLALPVIAAVVPLIATWSDVEWAHKALVLSAAPLSLFAIFDRTSARAGRQFAVVALLGLVLLFAAAFLEPFHDIEKPVTAIGGLLLGGAHVAWWRRHRSAPAP